MEKLFIIVAIIVVPIMLYCISRDILEVYKIKRDTRIIILAMEELNTLSPEEWNAKWGWLLDYHPPKNKDE